MKETVLQKHFVDAMGAEEGGFGTKLDANFINGIPDVYLSHLQIGRAWIEFKMAKTINRSLVNETALQRDYLKGLLKSGSMAGLLVCYDGFTNNRTRYYHVIHDKELILSDKRLYSAFDDCTIEQKYGHPYPALEVLKSLVRGQSVYA